MIRVLQTSEPASEELSEAVQWYEARRARLGGEFFDAVVVVAHLKRRPGYWKTRR
ncbi:MAG: hypothetical protein HY775_08410 [Acidobacteria bacterium]|nr:hypothetical protein [Acidobacteriota bacterium]